MPEMIILQTPSFSLSFLQLQYGDPCSDNCEII